MDHCLACGSGSVTIEHQYRHLKAKFCDTNCQTQFHLSLWTPNILSDGDGFTLTPAWKRLQRLECPKSSLQCPMPLGTTSPIANDEDYIDCTFRVGPTHEAAFGCRLVMASSPPDAPRMYDRCAEILGVSELHWPALRMQLDVPAQYEYLRQFDLAPEFATEKRKLQKVRAFRFELPSSTGDTTKMYATQRVIVETVGRLLFPYTPGSLEGALNLFVEALRAKDYALISSGSNSDDDDGLYYRNSDMLLSHLLYDRKSIETKFIDALYFILQAKTQALVILSIQDSVKQKLAPLGDLGRASRIVQLPGHEKESVVFALPALDEPRWPVLVDYYQQDHFKTYYSEQLNEGKKVTIVARLAPHGRVIGYATCTLHNTRPVENKRAARRLPTPEMIQFAMAESSGPYDVLSLDGLHVDSAWRGGRDKSIAVLLVFHVLYYARQCTADFGLQRVVSNSVARTTMLIMRQFGALFTDYSRALKWMKERRSDGLSIAQDLEYFRHFQGAARIIDSTTRSESQKLDALRALSEKNWKQWAAPDELLKTLVSDRSDWNTFLFVGERNTLFTEQMALFERLVAQHATVQQGELKGLLHMPLSALDTEFANIQ